MVHGHQVYQVCNFLLKPQLGGHCYPEAPPHTLPQGVRWRVTFNHPWSHQTLAEFLQRIRGKYLTHFYIPNIQQSAWHTAETQKNIWINENLSEPPGLILLIVTWNSSVCFLALYLNQPTFGETYNKGHGHWYQVSDWNGHAHAWTFIAFLYYDKQPLANCENRREKKVDMTK